MLLLLTGLIRIAVVMAATWAISKGAFTFDQFSPYENIIVNGIAVALVTAGATIWHQMESEYQKSKNIDAGIRAALSTSTLPHVSQPTPTIDKIDK